MKPDTVPAEASPAQKSRWLWCLGLFAAVLLIYLPCVLMRFVFFDDTFYVTENPFVPLGLTWEGIRWAFTTGHASNWHPLTWLSHMLDCQVFGLRPSAHHMVNVVFHAINSALVFIFLDKLRNARIAAVVAAAMFALHPLHVESVAWVAERKDVLCAFFVLLCCLAYLKFLDLETTKAPHRRKFYFLSLLAFIFALLSKPMAVTVPLLLPLLELWPMGRFPALRIARRFFSRRNLPFIFLAAASSLVTLVVQDLGGAVADTVQAPWLGRFEGIPIAYIWYLWKLLVPSKLAVLYPFVMYWPLWLVGVCSFVLIALSVLAFRLHQRYPWILWGWAWFIVTLIPVIGIIKVGAQFVADRYSYLPSIGIFAVAAWLVETSVRRLGRPFLSIAGGMAGALIVLYASLTLRQLRTWQDTETLFRHALAVTGKNAVAEINLGFYFGRCREFNLAIEHCRRAIACDPHAANAWNNLGCNLIELKKPNEALEAFQAAREIRPRLADVHNNIGQTLLLLARTNDAVLEYQKALECNPRFALTHFNLGQLLIHQGSFSAAEAHLRQSLAANPRLAQGHLSLAKSLSGQSRYQEALQTLQKALRIEPSLSEAYLEMGRNHIFLNDLSAAAADLKRALEINPAEAQAAIELANLQLRENNPSAAEATLRASAAKRPNEPSLHYHLAHALQARKDFSQSIHEYDRALALAADFPAAQNDLAWLLATAPDAKLRDGRRAVTLAAQACAATQYQEAMLVGTLAAAYAEAGQFDEAVEMARKASALAAAAGQPELSKRNLELLELYQRAQPYHEPL